MAYIGKDIILNDGFWLYPDYRQRVPTKTWKQILLNNDDTLICKGRLYKLKAKSLGFGVVEIYTIPFGDEK